MLLASGTARADEQCREQCQDSRRVCHDAAHRAHRVCQVRCDEAISTAIERVLHICREQQIDREQCAELVQRAVHAAGKSCRSDCRSASKQARATCRRERLECRIACAMPHDPVCVEECVDEAAMCGQDLDACASDCAATAAARIEQCREDFVDDRLERYRCVRRARHEGEVCATSCDEAFPCMHDLRDCLGDCVLEQ